MTLAGTRQFGLVPGASAVLIEARSNVGPITFATTEVEGRISVAFDGQAMDPDTAPSARLSIRLDSLRSGNALYDAELLRRVNARQHPETIIALRDTERIQGSDRYRVTGDLTFHGRICTIAGTLQTRWLDDGRLRVRGEQIVDIRDFDIAAPSMLMLRIYPDVRVQLQFDAEVIAERV